MFSRTILKWPFLTAAFFAAGLVCLAVPGRAGLLPSRTGSPEVLTRADLERELVIDALAAAGWSRDEAGARVARLTDGEVRLLAEAGMSLTAGGESGESGRALRVGLAIAVVLALFTGIYLFSTAD